VGLLISTLACAGEEKSTEAVQEAPAESATVAASEPAGPGPWVGEIREGIRDLPSRVTRDPLGARRAAIDLYASRQEALERRWGPGGTDAPDSTLARAVLEAEGSFHELLALLNRSQAPDSVEVAATVAALDARLDAVLVAAGEAP
jgi:hypothetical protein